MGRWKTEPIPTGTRLKPCKDCTDRCPKPNCHTNCEKYAEYRKEVEQFRKMQRDYAVGRTATAASSKIMGKKDRTKGSIDE